jgi:hypothetical protein
MIDFQKRVYRTRVRIALFRTQEAQFSPVGVIYHAEKKKAPINLLHFQ